MINTETIHITPELLNLLSEIDEFKGAWRALGTLAPQRLNALRGYFLIRFRRRRLNRLVQCERRRHHEKNQQLEHDIHHRRQVHFVING